MRIWTKAMLVGTVAHGQACHISSRLWASCPHLQSGYLYMDEMQLVIHYSLWAYFLYVFGLSYKSCFKNSCLLIPTSRSFWGQPLLVAFFLLQYGSHFSLSDMSNHFDLSPGHCRECVVGNLDSIMSLWRVSIFLFQQTVNSTELKFHTHSPLW